jgi:hypothetical protein
VRQPVPAGSRCPAHRTPASRTDARAAGWDDRHMNDRRKRNALDLFLDALTRPVRFR